MEDRQLLASDTQEIDLRSTVERGIERCREEEWEVGLALLRKAARKKGDGTSLPSLYYSYLGYGSARFEGKRKDGLQLCKHAVRVGEAEAENYFNLARVYLLVGDRRRAVAAAQHGLKFDSRCEPLLALRTEMGYRRRPPVSFLARHSWLNRWLGKRRHRKLERQKKHNQPVA